VCWCHPTTRPGAPEGGACGHHPRSRRVFRGSPAALARRSRGPSAVTIVGVLPKRLDDPLVGRQADFSSPSASSRDRGVTVCSAQPRPGGLGSSPPRAGRDARAGAADPAHLRALHEPAGRDAFGSEARQRLRAQGRPWRARARACRISAATFPKRSCC
jgi:hypothetical protein